MNLATLQKRLNSNSFGFKKLISFNKFLVQSMRLRFGSPTWAALILFTIAILLPTNVRAEEFKLVSTNSTMVIPFKSLLSSKIEESNDPNFYFLNVEFPKKESDDLAEITGKNMGNPLAVVINNYWISSPKIIS